MREHVGPLTIRARITLRYELVDGNGAVVAEHYDEDVLRDVRDRITEVLE